MKAKIQVIGVLFGICCMLWSFNIHGFIQSMDKSSNAFERQLLDDFKSLRRNQFKNVVFTGLLKEKEKNEEWIFSKSLENVEKTGAGERMSPDLSTAKEAFLKDEPGKEEGQIEEKPAEKHWTEEFSEDGKEGLTVTVNKTDNASEDGEFKPVISYKELCELNERISVLDKAKAMKILLSKLELSDIKLLKAMMEGGVTTNELEKAKRILEDKLTEKDKKELNRLYRKYIAVDFD